MSCVIKRRDSQYWIACFTDAQGRRLKRSTRIPAKERERKKAEKIAEKFEEVATKKRSALQVRRVIADLHAVITGETMVPTTLSSYVNGWLDAKQHEIKPSTMAFYRKAAERLLLFLGERAEEDISTINRQDLLEFRAAEAETLSPKTVNLRLKFCRMVFKAARRDALIDDDPSEFVKSVQDRNTTSRARRPFTMDEIRAVLRVADDEWKSMILFGLYSGQRLGDIARLTWANLDLNAGELRLVTEKTGKRIIIPLAGPLKEHVATLSVSKDPFAPIHPNAFETTQRQKRTGGLSNQFGTLLARAGLKKKISHSKTHGEGRGVGSASGGLTFHALRHTAITFLKEANIPVATVMELTGHDSKEMSEHYTHVGRESLKKAAEAFPNLLEKKPEGKG